jgi:excisionase family DNA binding protein
VIAGINCELRHPTIQTESCRKSGDHVRATLTVEEAAVVLEMSRAFAYEAVARGGIPRICIGRQILVPESPWSGCW